MNKKLGVILMFAGAYVVLLGGLFWNMSLPKGVEGNVYDWIWGVSAGVVIAGGAALAVKKNFLCPIGCGLSAIGIAYSIAILIIGAAKEKFFSIWILIGAILAAIGTVVALIYYFIEAEHIRKHGPILM